MIYSCLEHNKARLHSDKHHGRIKGALLHSPPEKLGRPRQHLVACPDHPETGGEGEEGASLLHQLQEEEVRTQRDYTWHEEHERSSNPSIPFPSWIHPHSCRSKFLSILLFYSYIAKILVFGDFIKKKKKSSLKENFFALFRKWETRQY